MRCARTQLSGWLRFGDDFLQLTAQVRPRRQNPSLPCCIHSSVQLVVLQCLCPAIHACLSCPPSVAAARHWCTQRPNMLFTALRSLGRKYRGRLAVKLATLKGITFKGALAVLLCCAVCVAARRLARRCGPAGVVERCPPFARLTWHWSGLRRGKEVDQKRCWCDSGGSAWRSPCACLSPRGT